MKPAPFAYHAPRSLGEALALLGTLDNPRPLAGGQSLVPILNYRLAAPDNLIDLGQIEELRGIAWTDAGLSIGCMTTQRILHKSPLVAEHCPMLIEALAHVGHQATRNRGTIGGSLCHLDPTAELPLVSQALEPTLTIASSRGVRQIPFAEFPVSQLTTQLEPDEILTRVVFPVPPPGTATAFEEFARRPGDFAIVAVAVQITVGAAGLVSDVRIAVAGLQPIAIRLQEVEQLLIGRAWSAERVDAVAAMTERQPAEGDHNNPADYRQHLAKTLTRRALVRAYAKRGAAVA